MLINFQLARQPRTDTAGAALLVSSGLGADQLRQLFDADIAGFTLVEVGLQLVTFLLVKPSLQTNKQAKNAEIVQMIIKSTTVNREDQLSLQLD